MYQRSVTTTFASTTAKDVADPRAKAHATDGRGALFANLVCSCEAWFGSAPGKLSEQGLGFRGGDLGEVSNDPNAFVGVCEQKVLSRDRVVVTDAESARAAEFHFD